jgi:hypothetical protein
MSNSKFDAIIDLILVTFASCAYAASIACIVISIAQL